MNIFAKPGLGQTELPPVNSDDNGKVLGVADGVWAKVAASGGSDLPDDPAQDGTYNLQNTVSSGTGTLSWASGGSSGGGVLVVHDVNGTLDKTWQEIADAGFAVCYVQPALPIMPEYVYVLCSIKDDEEEPYVQFYCGANEAGKMRQYDATSKNDYPVYVD